MAERLVRLRSLGLFPAFQFCLEGERRCCLYFWGLLTGFIIGFLVNPFQPPIYFIIFFFLFYLLFKGAVTKTRRDNESIY